MHTRSPSFVHFGGVSYLVRRPAVAPFVREASPVPYGDFVRFEGSEAELIGCGVATAEMFAGVKTRRTRTDEFGDELILTRDRRTWELCFRTHKDAPGKIPASDDESYNPWWRKHRAAIEAEVSEMLRRFAKPNSKEDPMRDLERRSAQAPCDYLKPQA